MKLICQILLMTLIVGCAQPDSKESKADAASESESEQEQVEIALAEPELAKAKGKKKAKNPDQSVSNFEEPGYNGSLNIRCNKPVSNQEEAVILTVTVTGKTSKKTAKTSRKVPRRCLGNLSLSVGNDLESDEVRVLLSVESGDLEYNYSAGSVSVSNGSPRVGEWEEQVSDGYNGDDSLPGDAAAPTGDAECPAATGCPQKPCDKTFMDGREICAI